MQITLEYVDPVNIEGLDSGDTIRVQKGLQLEEFVDKLEMNGHAQDEIKPVVNGEEVSFARSLKDGDEVRFIPDF